MKQWTFILPLLSLSYPNQLLQASEGVLSFDQDHSVLVGRLGEEESNLLSGMARLQRKGEADELHYALDRGGTLVGTCRTTHHRPGTLFQGEVPGDMDLALFDLEGRKIASETQDSLLRKIDANRGTKLRISVGNDHSRYMHCYRMGASNRNSRVVLYLQPLGYGQDSNRFAVEVQMRGKSFSITGFEIFTEHAAPARVVARDNPLKGNSVEVVEGQIRVNGAPVLRHGKPLVAESVKYRFK